MEGEGTRVGEGSGNHILRLQVEGAPPASNKKNEGLLRLHSGEPARPPSGVRVPAWEHACTLVRVLFLKHDPGDLMGSSNEYLQPRGFLPPKKVISLSGY